MSDFIPPKDECYNGIFNLKKAGVEVSLTAEQAEEMWKCANDVHYFINTYCKIISLDHGLVNFKTYEYQNRMIDKIKNNRFTIFLWPRQMGKSTTVAAILLHSVVFNQEYKIAILAQKADQAREILGRLQLMYQELPWWMQPGVVTWNKGNIILGNRSEAFTSATKGSGVRGKSINLLYLDEFAHVDNDVEFYESSYPVVTSGTTTKIVITSTPNGLNLFYKLCSEAEKKKNEYVFDRAHWYEHPKRDAKWQEEQLRNMTERQFEQEFECGFLGSAGTLISPSKIQQLTFEEPIRLLGDNREFKIYENPAPDRQYVLTADVSEGVGRDYSVISVIDVTKTPFKQVAMMRSNIMSPLLLADLINKTGRAYNDAVVIVESNTYGKQVTDCLWFDYEYENMLITRPHQQDAKITSSGQKSQPGVKTTKKTKLLGCSSLKGLIESDQLQIVDAETIHELSTFIKKGSSYEADQGKNDDIVMSLVIFAWFASQPYFSDMIDTNVRTLVRDNLLQQDEYTTAFGFLDDGTSDESEVSHELFYSFTK